MPQSNKFDVHPAATAKHPKDDANVAVDRIAAAHALAASGLHATKTNGP